MSSAPSAPWRRTRATPPAKATTVDGVDEAVGPAST